MQTLTETQVPTAAVIKTARATLTPMTEPVLRTATEDSITGGIVSAK